MRKTSDTMQTPQTQYTSCSDARSTAGLPTPPSPYYQRAPARTPQAVPWHLLCQQRQVAPVELQLARGVQQERAPDDGDEAAGL